MHPPQNQRRPWDGWSLRSRLQLLAAATILPFGVLAVIAFAAALHQQRVQAEQSTLAMARALAASISARMQQAIVALEAYSLTQNLSALQEEDVTSAQAAARLLRGSRPDWRSVLLARPDGTVVFASDLPLQEAPRQVVDRDSLLQTVRTQSPVVGPMAQGPRGNVAFTVRIPVMHSGELRYVLTAAVKTESVLDVIQQQQVPDGLLVSVFDSNAKRVARTKDNMLHFGSAPSPTLQALMSSLGSRGEALGTSTTLEGDDAITAVARIPGTGWTVAVGTHTAPLQAAIWRTSSLYLCGLALSLGVGCLVFWMMSRSITTRAQRLQASAAALGRGEAVTVPDGGLPEFDTVAHALKEAGEIRTRAEAERETLLQSERAARAAAEGAQARLQLVLSATTSIAQSFDESKALGAIASAIVPSVADICRIDLLDADGALVRKLTFHRDPAKVGPIDEVVRSGHISPDTPGSMPWVIASRREYVHRFDPARLHEIKDPLFRRFVEVTGMRAVCLVPLIARDRAIGAMAVLQAESGRDFDAQDIDLLCELGRRAALALDNLRLLSECTTALEKAKEASKAKDDFLAMLGHELRNPLAPILTALEIVKRKEPTGFTRERQIIERQAKHLSHLVDDLLDVSRIASGKVRLHREKVALQDVVKQAFELSAPLFERRDPPALSAPDEDLLVEGDLVRLCQVVTNLLSNAVKFSDAQQPIAVELRQRQGLAVLAVEDEGVGIPAELLPHVFDRFFQGAQDLQRSKGGLGLGLAIARGIVELHGGSIEVAPGRSGRGTRVTVSLPLLRAEPAPAFVSAPASEGKTPLRILVVDDNKDAADMLVVLLSLSGHEVDRAASAEECLDVVEALRPQVCMLDIGLPGMDGYELARRLRRLPQARSMFLLAITGYGQQEDKHKAIEAGFDAHMTKPIDPQLLDQVLAKASAASGR